MSLKGFKESFQNVPIVSKGKYQYVIHPITDGVPEITPELLREITYEMKHRIQKLGKIDKIVTMEAMGIPVATALSLRMGIPFTIIRKREYGLPNEVSVEQVTGYSKSKLFINGLEKSDRVIIVDDVLSTGGTLGAVLSVFKKMGVLVKGVFIAVDKGKCAEEIGEEFNVQIHTLVKIDVVDGKVVIKK